MHVISLAAWHVLMAAALGAPAVEIETLKGDRRTGELVALDATAAQLKSGAVAAEVPLADVLEVRFPTSPPADPSTGPRVTLIDGTRLTLAGFSVAGDQARCEASFGEFKIAVARLDHVRFGISTTKLD